MLEKSERIYVRATPEEKEQLLAAARLAGLTLSAYLLWRAGVGAGDLLARHIQEDQVNR